MKPFSDPKAAAAAANKRWAEADEFERFRQNALMMAGQERRFARVALGPDLSDDELAAAIAATPATVLLDQIVAARKAHMTRASQAAAKARTAKARAKSQS